MSPSFTMAIRLFHVILSMEVCFICTCQGQSGDRLSLTLLDLGPLQSESRSNKNNQYQCYVSDRDTTDDDVDSHRLGYTRDGEANNPDPPDTIDNTINKYPRWLVNLDATNNNAFGVFGCTASRNGELVTKVSTVRMRSNAKITPRNNLYTQTVSIGDEDVQIEMQYSLQTEDLQWIKDNDTLTSADGTSSYQFKHPITLNDAGIYECFIDGERNDALHGLKLLLVRACPAKRWGLRDCSGICDNCYNGGVCDEANGDCICPPGFRGSYCEIECGFNRFGRNCEFRCSSKNREESCRGNLYCRPHPFGCTCNTGFQGLGCQDACDTGKYGASCLQTCNCQSGECNRYTGVCTGSDTRCGDGWMGSNCQKECTSDSFGPDCQGTCHCESIPCDRLTGKCISGGCSAGWTGPNCQNECRAPQFGLMCSKICNCQNATCDHIVGCTGAYYPEWTSATCCTIGIIDSDYTSKNPGITVPVTCTMNKDNFGNHNQFELVLSRLEMNLDASGINTVETTGNATARTVEFLVDSVDDGATLYCHLRKNDIRSAVRVVSIDLYDLPVLESNPKKETVEATSVTISWSEWNEDTEPGDPPVVGYIPYCYNPSREEWLAGTSDAIGNLTFTFRDLDPETIYIFSVAAVREGEKGEGPRSPSVTIKTICAAPFSGPIDVEAHVSGDSQEHVEITWKKPADEDVRCGLGVAGYTIYYSSKAGLSLADSKTREVFNPDTTSYIFQDLDVGQTYTFQMSLTTEGGESSLSEGVDHLLPILPSLRNPPIVDDSTSCGRKVKMTWTGWTEGEDEGTPPIIGYCPYYKLAAEEEWIADEFVHHESDNVTMYFTFENLNDSTSYNFSLSVVRAEDGGEGGKNGIIDHETTPCTGPPLGAILGSIFGGLLLILLALLILLLWRKQKSDMVDYNADKIGITSAAFSYGNKNITEVTDEESENLYLNIDKPTPILIKDLENYLKNCEKSTYNSLQQQFQSLKKGKQYPSEVGEKEINKQKNRFKNMIAYDHSRVILQTLSEDHDSDYYNANYIKNDEGVNAFIACQGPNTASRDDFWRMIVQENVSNIVMLTNLVEKGKDKCKQYWPESVGATAKFEKWEVKWESTESFKDYDIRVLELSYGNENHRVKNWHYKTWPDMDVPEQATPLIELAKRVKLHQSAANGPLLVHCSAGVGRTGTFIALYTLMEIVKTEDRIDIYGFVEKMRENRIMMVQTAIQFQFLHLCLLECYLSGETDISMEKIATFDVQEKTGKLGKEFKLLAKFDKMSQKASRAKAEDAQRCRFPLLVPVESKRPFLQCLAKSGANNFINACFCSTFAKKNAFIATQSPLPTTVEDFWRLIFDWNCPLIVMLNSLDPNDQTCCKYWPDQGSVQYGYITLKLKEEQNQGFYEYRVFEITHFYDKKKMTVHHMRLNSWDDGSYIKELVEDMEKLSESYKMEGPQVVHCINGVSRTGIFLTIKSEMERSRKDSKLDVFNSVRILRGSNHSLVLTKNDYILCHQLLKMAYPEEAQYANI